MMAADFDWGLQQYTPLISILLVHTANTTVWSPTSEMEVLYSSLQMRMCGHGEVVSNLFFAIVQVEK